MTPTQKNQIADSLYSRSCDLIIRYAMYSQDIPEDACALIREMDNRRQLMDVFYNRFTKAKGDLSGILKERLRERVSFRMLRSYYGTADRTLEAMSLFSAVKQTQHYSVVYDIYSYVIEEYRRAPELCTTALGRCIKEQGPLFHSLFPGVEI